MRTEAPLLAPVFRSEGQARLLAAALVSGDEVSISDLAALADVAYPTAHREVSRLLAAGIFVERLVGKTRLIAANTRSPLVPPLRELVLIAMGAVPLLAGELRAVPGVELAFLYGSFAARMRGVDGPAPQDIDVMVVGSPDAGAVYDACARVEKKVRRPVNPTIVTRDDLAAQSGFMLQVRDSPHVVVVGETPWD